MQYRDFIGLSRLLLFMVLGLPLTIFGAPDIVVNGTPTANPNPVTAGQTVTINYTVKNVGDAATLDASTTRIQIKPVGSTTAIADANFSLPSLNQNASSTRSSTLSIPAGTTAGSYKVYIILDRYSETGQTATGEANDDDTNFNLTIQGGGAPDIVVDGTPTANPNPVTAGQSVTINYTVRNVGNAATLSSSTTRIQIKPVGSTTAIADDNFSLPSLNMNTSSVRSSTLSIPAGTAAGSYKVYIILDRYDDTGQTAAGIANDDDTNFSLTIQGGAAPDLVVDGMPTANPNPVTAGQTVTINYTVKNVGDAATLAASTTRIQIKPAGSTVAVADANFSLSSLNQNASSAEFDAQHSSRNGLRQLQGLYHPRPLR